MSNHEGTIRPATRGNHDAMTKPVPPSDLWAQLDALNQEVYVSRPPDVFTVKEYAERYSMSYSNAGRMVTTLIEKGRVERVGKWYRITLPLPQVQSGMTPVGGTGPESPRGRRRRKR